MKRTLIVPFEFYASHSLSVRETPHTHQWTLKLFIEGESKTGIVINILDVRKIAEPFIDKLSETYLNENPALNEEQSAFPTCETLCDYFYSNIASKIEQNGAKLQAVEVELREFSGIEWGSAKLSNDS